MNNSFILYSHPLRKLYIGLCSYEFFVFKLWYNCLKHTSIEYDNGIKRISITEHYTRATTVEWTYCTVLWVILSVWSQYTTHIIHGIHRTFRDLNLYSKLGVNVSLAKSGSKYAIMLHPSHHHQHHDHHKKNVTHTSWKRMDILLYKLLYKI